MEAKFEQKGKFEFIVQTLEESLIVIEGNRIDLANDQFLRYFKDPILKEAKSESLQDTNSEQIDSQNGMLKKCWETLKNKIKKR